MPIFIFLSCSCPDGWFGVMCREESTVCTTGKHACAEGSECAVHPNGTYFCLCPFGRRGTLCEEGSRPYMIWRITGSVFIWKLSLSLALHT